MCNVCNVCNASSSLRPLTLCTRDVAVVTTATTVTTVTAVTSSPVWQLKLCNQRVACSQRAEEALAAALESNTTLQKLAIELRSQRARDVVAHAL